MHVCECEKLIPIKIRDCVLSIAIMESDRTHDWLIQRWHLIGTEVLCAQQPVQRSGGHACAELALWISPLVIFRSRDVDGAGSNQRDQLVSVDRKLIGVVGIFLVVRAELV